MRRFMLSTILALALVGGVGAPVQPAEAADCIDSCDDDFGSGNWYRDSVRGWCYIFRCYLL